MEAEFERLLYSWPRVETRDWSVAIRVTRTANYDRGRKSKNFAKLEKAWEIELPRKKVMP